MATTTGYCGDSGGGVDSNGGGKSNGSVATTMGYGGNGGSLRRKFGESSAPTSGDKKSNTHHTSNVSFIRRRIAKHYLLLRGGASYKL